MALLHLSSSPSPRPQRTSGTNYDKCIHGQVPSNSLKPVIRLRKIKRTGAFSEKADCKDAHLEAEAVSACIHGYGEPLCSNGVSVMETLKMGRLVSAVDYQGFRKVHRNLASFNVSTNPYEVNADYNVSHASPNVFNSDPDVLNHNSNGFNTNPNVVNGNPDGFNDNHQPSFNGGDDSGKGSGSGGQGSGHGGHNFGPGGHYDPHDRGLAILGIHSFFLNIDDGRAFNDKAAFDSLNSLLSTFFSMPASAGWHVKWFNAQDPRTEVDDQDIACIGRASNEQIHAFKVGNDYGMHGQNMTDLPDLPAHNVHSSPSLLDDGFNEKSQEKTSDGSNVCSTCSSQTNSLPSDIAAETHEIYQRLYTFLTNVLRHVLHTGCKFSGENHNVSVNVSTQIDVMHGDMPCDDRGEIGVKAYDFEGAVDSMVLLAGSEQDMEFLSCQPSEMRLDDAAFSLPSANIQMAAHHEPQGLMGWLWQGTHPAVPKQTDSHDNTSKAMQVTQQESRVSSSEGVMGWLGQLARPALARQADSHDNTSKADQVTQQESRVSSSEGTTLSPKVDSQSSETPSGAKQSDIDALKRLQRETFSELMKLREKLEKLEQLAQARLNLDKVRAAQTHLNGHVKAGAAFVLLEGSSSRQARDSLEQAGMQTGLDVKFTFETPFREKDVLITQCLSGQGSSVGDGRALGGPLSVGKLHYVAHVNDDVSISFAPLGAHGKDVTEVINVLQDDGLTAFSSQGPALFNHCKGSALGTTVSGSRFAFSLAQYLSGWGNQASPMGSFPEKDPLCLSTLGQFLLQPTEGFILSLSAVNRYWPSPPLPSSMALHWSEMGPLVIPKIQAFKENQLCMVRHGSMCEHMNSVGSHWEAPDLECGVNAYENKGTGLLSLAIASSLDLGENFSVSGWAQIDRGELLEDLDRGNVQWALSVAKTSENGIGWGASIGCSRPDIWSRSPYHHDDSSGYDANSLHGPQLQAEAFLKLHCGRGFTLQPGLLYISNMHSHTPAFVVRSSWSL